MIEDPLDRRLALGADGVLAQLNRADVLAAADVHVALRLADIAGESDADVKLATALAVGAVRQGATALDLRLLPDLSSDDGSEHGDGHDWLQDWSGWPDPDRWLDALRRSRLVAAGVLRVDEDLLYLDRYWREEVQVRDDLVARLDREEPEIDSARLEEGVLRVYPRDGYQEQRAAAAAAARRWTTVLTGGPGTGKTATVAGLLALLAEQDSAAGGRGLRIGLCAPTGKAAARLQQSVREELAQLPAEDRDRLGELSAMTLHRLLGWKPESSVRFRHDRRRRLPHDVIVVDETSMVSLTLMARLLEAVRPSARLILVGDKDQLSSVEAGAVLADLVEGLRHRNDSPVTQLLVPHRYGGAIADLAQALRDDDADRVVEVLRAGGEVELVDPADEVAVDAFRQRAAEAAYSLTQAAEAGDAAAALDVLDSHRLLCAHREGPFGVGGWNRVVERLLADRTGITHYEEWYAGRPVLVSANDAPQDVYNGDVGVTVREGGVPEGRLRVAISDPGGPRLFAPTRLPEVTTMYAMTVHKSQGSQAREVSLVLPPDDSPLLTHELFYTAVTRAQQAVHVLGTEAAVRAAVERRVQRASGLARRLQHGGG